MAVIVPFQEVVQARRRAHERACHEHCIALIETNLRFALDEFDAAPPDERPVYARRIRHLSALLDYAVQAS